MVQKVADWKAAEGDRKIELLEELKSLTAKKKELEIELDAKVAGKDKDVKLAIEGNAFESAVTENYEVIYSDGISAMKKFRTESQALDFMEKEIKSNKKLRDIAVYKPGMHSTTQTELVVKFWGDGSYLDNVSKRDSKLATKKLEESVVNEAKAVKVTKQDWPYVEFKVGGKKHKVEFDYEDIIDDHGNEGQDQYWIGKDEDGKEWSIDVYADYNGDVQDVHYDTIVAESVVTEKKEEKDEAAEIEAEIEKLTKENKYGYAKDIKRLKVRLSAVNMMKKFNKNNESKKVAWDNLLEEFEIVETTNEDIRSDVKKWIRTNKEELNDLADADEWDAMYDKLYSEFGVEADSIKAKDLLKTFQFVF